MAAQYRIGPHTVRNRIRAILWAMRARIVARRASLRSGFDGVEIARAPETGLQWTRDVQRVLSVTRSNCLVVSIVLQEWYAAQGHRYDLVIGVTPPSAGFRAHAWLDMPEEHIDGYAEITRVSARESGPVDAA
jgi:hypothetical protein